MSKDNERVHPIIFYGVPIILMLILFPVFHSVYVTAIQEPEYYTGQLKDINISMGGLGSRTTSILYFVDGKVLTVNKLFDDLQIGDTYTFKYSNGNWNKENE